MLNINKIESDINSNNLQSKDVSEIIGVKYTTTINRRSKGNWTPNDVEKLADYFGRSISYYFDREEDDPYRVKNQNEDLNNGIVQEPENNTYNCSKCRERKKTIAMLEHELSSLKSKYIDALEELQNKKDQGKCG